MRFVKATENLTLPVYHLVQDTIKAVLDASLPAAVLYEKLGYKTAAHKKLPLKNAVVLVYEIMEKIL